METEHRWHQVVAVVPTLGGGTVVFGFVYAPPKGSPYADEGLFDNIAAEVGMIQDLGGSILLIGDFNVRISAADDYVDCRYFTDHMPGTLPLGNDFPEVLPEQHNSDKGGLKGWHNKFLRPLPLLGIAHSQWQDRRR
jgi:hypothetical protein